MSRLRVSEKTKLIIACLGVTFSILLFILFCFKLPSIDDYNGILASEEPNIVMIENGVIYEQTFKSQVDNLYELSVLFLRENDNAIEGTIHIELYDENDTMLHRQSYEADMIPNMNLVANFVGPQGDTVGDTYTVKVYSENLTPSSLGLGVIPLKTDTSMLNNDEKTENNLVISYKGKTGDKTMFWYPLMLITLMIPLLATIDFEELKRRKCDEK